MHKPAYLFILRGEKYTFSNNYKLSDLEKEIVITVFHQLHRNELYFFIFVFGV